MAQNSNMVPNDYKLYQQSPNNGIPSLNVANNYPYRYYDQPPSGQLAPNTVANAQPPTSSTNPPPPTTTSTSTTNNHPPPPPLGGQPPHGQTSGPSGQPGQGQPGQGQGQPMMNQSMMQNQPQVGMVGGYPYYNSNYPYYYQQSNYPYNYYQPAPGQQPQQVPPQPHQGQPQPQPQPQPTQSQPPSQPQPQASGAGSGQSPGQNQASPVNNHQSTQPPLSELPSSSTQPSQPSSTTNQPGNAPQFRNLNTDVNLHSHSTVGQYQPPGIRPRVTTTMWEDEKTLCYQVDANNVSVVRRADNNMINGTKLLNVAQMTRGRRDGILKSEKVRHVVKIGSMHLKGVWIPFERALAMAQREGIVDLLYPLFVRDIKRVIQTGISPNKSFDQSNPSQSAPPPSQTQPPALPQQMPPPQHQQPPPLGQQHSPAPPHVATNQPSSMTQPPLSHTSSSSQVPQQPIAGQLPPGQSNTNNSNPYGYQQYYPNQYYYNGYGYNNQMYQYSYPAPKPKDEKDEKKD